MLKCRLEAGGLSTIPCLEHLCLSQGTLQCEKAVKVHLRR